MCSLLVHLTPYRSCNLRIARLERNGELSACIEERGAASLHCILPEPVLVPEIAGTVQANVSLLVIIYGIFDLPLGHYPELDS